MRCVLAPSSTSPTPPASTYEPAYESRRQRPKHPVTRNPQRRKVRPLPLRTGTRRPTHYHRTPGAASNHPLNTTAEGDQPMTTPAHAPDQPTRLLDALDDMTTTPRVTRSSPAYEPGSPSTTSTTTTDRPLRCPSWTPGAGKSIVVSDKSAPGRAFRVVGGVCFLGPGPHPSETTAPNPALTRTGRTDVTQVVTPRSLIPPSPARAAPTGGFPSQTNGSRPHPHGPHVRLRNFTSRLGSRPHPHGPHPRPPAPVTPSPSIRVQLPADASTAWCWWSGRNEHPGIRSRARAVAGAVFEHARCQCGVFPVDTLATPSPQQNRGRKVDCLTHSGRRHRVC